MTERKFFSFVRRVYNRTSRITASQPHNGRVLIVVSAVMSVLLNTSAGDLVVDLFVDSCPIATKNFLKLCQVKYYNNCLFYNVQQNFIAQTGDPTGTGKGGSSIYGLLNGNLASTFDDEVVKGRKINRVGMVGMAHSGSKENSNRSQFFITLRGEDMDQFETSHTIFGEIAEGLDVLEKINSLYCDGDGRPYQDVRILHTYILDDPFSDPPGLQVPPASPDRTYPQEERVKRRLPYQETIEDDADGKTAEELDASIRRKEAKSRAIVLEMTGDLPDADVKPPDEVLFVCKLNPVTTDEDLELIFSRFGIIKSCEVIRDFKTGDSLNYAFIEFETAGACIEAYEKMNNVLIDDRRIKVDFSQSVSKLWNRFLLQPRKDGPKDGANTATKPGEKPSYYMRQPGMSFDSKPAAAVPPSTSAPAVRQGGGHNSVHAQERKDREPRRADSRDRHHDKARSDGDAPRRTEHAGDSKPGGHTRERADSRDRGRSGWDRSRSRERARDADRHRDDRREDRKEVRKDDQREDRRDRRADSRDRERTRDKDHRAHADRDGGDARHRDSARDKHHEHRGSDDKHRDRDRKRDRSPASRSPERSRR